MGHKDSENPSGLSYELDLDDTISSWDQVVEEAVAAVERKDDVRTVRDVNDAVTEEDSPDSVAEHPDQTPARAAGHGEGDSEAAAEPGDAAEDREDEAREDDTQVRDLRDRLVRTLADFDNFRKRTEREKASIKRFALFDVLKDFLGVQDNLERALAASGSAEDLKTGVEMIARQFADLLARHGVEPVPAIDEVFDPTVHEAVSREEAADVTEPTVTAELQRGYRLHDRLLRPALVTVAMPPPSPPPDEEASSEEEVFSEDPDDDAVLEAEARDDLEDSRSQIREGQVREDNDEAPGERLAQATEVS